MKDKKDIIDSLRKGKREARKEWSTEVDRAATSTVPGEVNKAEILASMKPALALSDYEKDIYTAVAEYLSEAGMLNQVDSITLTMLARNLFMYKMANENLKDFEDYLQVHTNGAISPSAAANLSKQAEDQILKLSTKLGLSPADRAKILGSLPKPDKGDEPDPLLQ